MRKEFGKTKIFWPSQEGLAALSPEEAVARQARLKAVQEEAKTASEAVAVLRKGSCRTGRPMAGSGQRSCLQAARRCGGTFRAEGAACLARTSTVLLLVRSTDAGFP